MTKITKNMKLAKTSQEEISSLMEILNEVDQLKKDFQSRRFEDIDWDDYEIMKTFPRDDAEDFLEALANHISGTRFHCVLWNCSVLLDNCADPNQDVLDFNEDIKEGLLLLEMAKEKML